MAKKSIMETWQALKTIDAYDRKLNDQRVHTNWNSFSYLSKTTESNILKVDKVEDPPFILGTQRYHFTPGELQKTLSSAAKAILESQEEDQKQNQSNHDPCIAHNNDGDGHHVPKTVVIAKQFLSSQKKEKIVATNDADLMFRINMDVNCLLDQVADVRYEALLSIHCALLGDFPGEVCQNPRQLRSNELVEDKVACKGLFECPDKFIECVKEVVTKSLLRKFEDTSEKCRLLAISIITALFQSSPPAMVSLMSYILPVLIERFPIKSLPTTEDSDAQVEILIVENSEEVRLKLVQLLHTLLTFAKKKTKYFASEVASILTAAAMDSYHEVLVETFATMTFFGELCKQKLKPVAKQLISVVLHSLSHNRKRVRVGAIKAIHRLVLCGAHESVYDLIAYRDPNLVPIKAFYQPCPKTQYLALLVSDRSIQVREQLLVTVASWLCELPERKEHDCRLIPYMLTGFTDENPKIQDLAFDLMEKVGRRYEEENQSEVADVQVYLPEDIEDFENAKTQFLPQAFKCRPCLGARIMVRSCLAVMLHALGADLEAWTSGTKAKAAEFLYTLIIFAEENITMHLQALIVIMQKAFKEPLVEKQIVRCANVLGFFPEPEVYLKIIEPMINGELYGDMSTKQLGASLKMLASIMQGSPSSRLTRHIPEICTLLTTPDLLTSIQQEVNEGTVAIARELVGAWSRDDSNELVPLLWILLNAAASSDFCGRAAAKSEGLLEDLAGRFGAASGRALVASHAEKILDLLPHPLFWAVRSFDVLVYCRVLHVAALTDLETLPRVFRILMFFGRGSSDTDLKQR
ncbi:unnamed protein product [Calypogeia fissa]